MRAEGSGARLECGKFFNNESESIGDVALIFKEKV
jgi:hypothetical protein